MLKNEPFLSNQRVVVNTLCQGWTRVTGQRSWSGWVTGRTRYMTQFWVLTCAFVVALFLQS